MTATPEQQAPGCFASASVYGADSVVCQACPAYNECGNASLKTLESIRQLVDVRDLMERHKAARQRVAARLAPPGGAKPVVASPIPVSQPAAGPIERTTGMIKTTFDASPEDQATIDMLGNKNIKAKEQAITLCKTNRINEMREQLPIQGNPFNTSGPKYLRVACDMLIRGGFTKASFKMRLMEELGWVDTTAGSHVALACALLYSFKIASPDQSGSFTLNPDLYRNNQQSQQGK